MCNSTDKYIISKGDDVRENILRWPVEVNLPMMEWRVMQRMKDAHETRDDCEARRIGRAVMRSLMRTERSIDKWEWSFGLHEFENTSSPDTACIHCFAHPSSKTVGASRLIFEFRSRQKQFTAVHLYST